MGSAAGSLIFSKQEEMIVIAVGHGKKSRPNVLKGIAYFLIW